MVAARLTANKGETWLPLPLSFQLAGNASLILQDYLALVTWHWLPFFPQGHLNYIKKNFCLFLTWYDLVFNGKHSASFSVTQKNAWFLTEKMVLWGVIWCCDQLWEKEGSQALGQYLMGDFGHILWVTSAPSPQVHWGQGGQEGQEGRDVIHKEKGKKGNVLPLPAHAQGPFREVRAERVVGRWG